MRIGFHKDSIRVPDIPIDPPKIGCYKANWVQAPNAVTNSATFTAPEASDEDLEELLLEILPPDSSTISNLQAKEALILSDLQQILNPAVQHRHNSPRKIQRQC